MTGCFAIIGGTGTLGRSLVKTVLGENPQSHILIISRDEIKQLEMMDDFPSSQFPNLKFKLGDVRDLERMTEVLSEIDFVVHAAAIKHVVMAEMNPEECRKTNISGTENVVKACNANKVKRAVLISTDKAENPIGVYGQTKLEAERIFQEANSTGTTNFSIIRLGNILGSRGSVVERFNKMKESGQIEITHPDATRFCIEGVEAANFVIEHFEKEDFSQVEFPKMKSFRVIDLAKLIAPNAEIKFTGLRPGDKLHEELNKNHTSSLELIQQDQLKEILNR